MRLTYALHEQDCPLGLGSAARRGDPVRRTHAAQHGVLNSISSRAARAAEYPAWDPLAEYSRAAEYPASDPLAEYSRTAEYQAWDPLAESNGSFFHVPPPVPPPPLPYAPARPV